MKGSKHRSVLAMSLVLVAPGLASCFAPSGVTRVVDGVPVRGRYVPPEAYAKVMQAALLEEAGELQAAAVAYREASQLDGRSPEIWTRLAAVSCQLGESSAKAAFDQALDLDPNYEPAWQELARCRLRNGAFQTGLTAARRAVMLDPWSCENTVLALTALQQSRQVDDYRRWAIAYRVSKPLPPAPNPGCAFLAPSDPSRDDDTGELERALIREDLPQARSIAVSQGMSATELALHALRLGRPSAALAQAQLVLGANPGDANARIAALVAADWLGDSLRFDALLVTPNEPVPNLHPFALELLEGLLARRTGEAVPAPSIPPRNGEPGSPEVQNHTRAR